MLNKKVNEGILATLDSRGQLKVKATCFCILNSKAVALTGWNPVSSPFAVANGLSQSKMKNRNKKLDT